MSKLIIILGLSIAIIIAAVWLMVLAVSFVETTIPANSYLVKVSGLAGLEADGPVTVMVPVPAGIDADLAISRSSLESATADGWNTSVVGTPYGTMLSFTSAGENLNDIFYAAGEFETEEEPRLLMPFVGTPGNLSVSEFCRQLDGNYATMVYKNCNLKSGTSPPSPVRVVLEYRGGGGMKHLVKEDAWYSNVDTTFPAGECGYLTVRAGYMVVKGGLTL